MTDSLSQFAGEPLGEKQAYAPICCHVVPIIAEGVGLDHVIQHALERLRSGGSVASPGFMKPEGIVAFHTHSRTLFKVTLERDQEPKSMRAA